MSKNQLLYLCIFNENYNKGNLFLVYLLMKCDFPVIETIASIARQLVTNKENNPVLLVIQKTPEQYLLRFVQVNVEKYQPINYQRVIKSLIIPLIVDVDGDLQMQIIIKNQQGIQILKIINQQVLKIEQYFPQFSFNDTFKGLSFDFSGDCKSDLIIYSTNIIQFWKRTQNKFNLIKNISYGQKIENIILSDFDHDGKQDLLISSLNHNPHFKIIFSQTTSYNCKEQNQFPYQFQSFQSLYQKSFNGSQLKINPIDFNIDGYTDLILVIDSKLKVLQNMNCQKCQGYNDNKLSDIQRHKLVFKQIELFSKMQFSVITASSFDLYQDGKIDILINYINSQKQNKIIFYINNLKSDAFFIKIKTTSSQYSNSHSYGIHYQFQLTLLNGDYKLIRTHQLTSVFHDSLLLPYAFVGLSRTNNYIQNLIIGIPLSQNQYRKQWTPIIPNSQLIIILKGMEKSKWQLGIFIEPTSKIYWVIILSVIVLILFGLIIVRQHVRQKHQDKKNLNFFYQILR